MGIAQRANSVLSWVPERGLGDHNLRLVLKAAVPEGKEILLNYGPKHIVGHRRRGSAVLRSSAPKPKPGPRFAQRHALQVHDVRLCVVCVCLDLSCSIRHIPLVNGECVVHALLARCTSAHVPGQLHLQREQPSRRLVRAKGGLAVRLPRAGRFLATYYLATLYIIVICVCVCFILEHCYTGVMAWTTQGPLFLPWRLPAAEPLSRLRLRWCWA